jgi:hypothetical protein
MKTKTILLTCGLWLCLQQVSAQAPEWSRLMQVPTYGNPSVSCVAANTDYVATAGMFSGALTFDGASLNCGGGLRDLFVQLSLISGDKIWIRQFSATVSLGATAIQIDALNNIYFTGSYSGNATFGEFTLSGGNSFLIKIDVYGKVQWAVSFSSLSSSPRQIEVDSSGNCYLACFADQLIKFNYDGIVQWNNPLPNNILRSMSVSGDFIYLGGNLPTGTTIFDPFIFTKSYRTGIILKANLEGKYLDFLEVGKANIGYGTGVGGIEHNSRGNLIITGYYFGALEFRGDTWFDNNPAVSYPFIALCDPNLAVQWAQSGESINYGNTLNFKVYTDADDNVYLYSNSSGFQFGTVFVPGGYSLLRCDPLGIPVEATNLYPMSSAVCAAPDGSYFHCGSYSTETPDLMGNIFVRKVDWSAGLQWHKISTGSQGGSFRFNYGIHDKNGNLYTSGKFTGYTNYFGTPVQAPGQRTIISKLEPSGQVIWSQVLADLNSSSSNYPFGPQVANDHEGRLITTGRFDLQIKLGSFTLVNQNLDPDGYVIRFSTTGEVEWVTQFHTTGGCDIYGVAVDHNGYVIVTGVFMGLLQAGGHLLDSGPGEAVFVIKLDQDGNRLWGLSFPGDDIYLAMPALDPDGNIYVACEYYNPTTGIIDFGGVTTPQGPDDGGTVLCKLDATGDVKWVRTYGGSTLDPDPSGWPTAIKIDDQGNCYLWGWCTDQAVFGGKTFYNPLKVTSTQYNFYITKIDPTGEVVWADVVFEKNYSFNYGHQLDLDKAGNVYVGGHFRDTIEVSGQRFKPESTNDLFIIKYSNDGNFRWIKTLPTGSTNFSCLSVLKENSVTVSGITGVLLNVGSYPVIRNGGPTGVMATLGDLLPHFVPVWSGNGVDQMNINIYSALLDGLDLAEGDEIGVFDGERCVGAGVVDQTITSGNLLNLVVSRDDGSGNGYTPGHTITFRYYDLSAGREVDLVTATYDDGRPEWSTDGLFAIGATAFAALNGKTTSLLTLSLLEGWNLISSNVTPEEPDMEVLFQPLIIPSQLLKVMDEAGNAMENLGSFGGWQNAIGDLALTEGYKVKVTTDCQLTLEGEPAPLPMDIPLSTGWNIIGFPYPWAVTATDIVQQLITRGTLLKVQDEAGHSIEDYGSYGGWVNNIGSFQPGKGYKVKVNAPDMLNLPELIFKSSTMSLSEVPTRHFIPVFRGNGVDHMNINLVGLSSGFLRPGDELGVFDGESCVGALTLLPRHLEARLVSIPASAAEPGDNTGFTEGHPIRLQLWKAATGEITPLEAEIIRGSSSFRKNESLLATLQKYSVTATSLEEMSAMSVYPNPSTGKVTIRVTGRETGVMEVSVLNPAGQTVLTRRWPASQGEVNLSGNTPGIYTIRVKHDGGCLTQRITLK